MSPSTSSLPGGRARPRIVCEGRCGPARACTPHVGAGGLLHGRGRHVGEAPSRVIQKIRVARDGHLGYGPGDRLRLLRATRRAARHLAAGVPSTRQGASRLELAISALEQNEPPLKACVASWGACCLLSSHVKNAIGRGPRCRSDRESVDCEGDGEDVVMVPMVAWRGRGPPGVRRDESLRGRGVEGRHVAVVGGASSVEGRAVLTGGRDWGERGCTAPAASGRGPVGPGEVPGRAALVPPKGGQRGRISPVAGGN